ncbi:MAG: hypothetical protein CMH25_04375 [Micavibrio sp.]|nr:hypothetical protein [Micavibrio sp.]|tara:strand:+ start:1295 stop:1591 length:297 start_codon:yes stop_codon:yes gene_type:complete
MNLCRFFAELFNPEAAYQSEKKITPKIEDKLDGADCSEFTTLVIDGEYFVVPHFYTEERLVEEAKLFGGSLAIAAEEAFYYHENHLALEKRMTKLGLS